MDRLESELGSYFIVVRLSVASDVGKYVRWEYQGDIVPTFIIFDKDGNEFWRRVGSVPNLEEINKLNL